MRKNLAVESVNDIICYITQPDVGNHNSMFMFLFLVIGIGSLLSLPVLTIMINAQSYPDSTSGNNHTGNTTSTSNATSTSNDTRVTKMGICVVGVRSPCNGDSNSPK
jgi:hypothetical protein